MVGLEVEVRDQVKIGDLEEPLLGEDMLIVIPIKLFHVSAKSKHEST